jgi:hypothetical protein
MAKRRAGVQHSPPEAVLPDRALCLPTLSQFLIVNKTFLSLSLRSDQNIQIRVVACFSRFSDEELKTA